MTERLRKTVASLSLVLACVGAQTACGGSGSVEIPIETPIAPKLDITPFQRVYVAGFLAGAGDDVDANMETVRLIRSQLRNKNILRVVDADTLPLAERALQEVGSSPSDGPPPEDHHHRRLHRSRRCPRENPCRARARASHPRPRRPRPRTVSSR